MAEVKTNKAVRAFLKKVNEEIITGRASERSYYPAIERLVESFAPNINAQIEQAGDASKPDFAVERRKNRIGVIEVKEPCVSLEEIEKAAAAGRPEHNAEQFNRYLREYDNLLYTNLLEWRRFRHHVREAVQTAVIAALGADGKLHLSRDGLDDFERLVSAYLAARPEPETTAKGLALKMAPLTKELDVNTQKALAAADPYLQGLFEVFQAELIHGLKADEFADMYAQTVAYGLFTARVMQRGAGDFNRGIAGELLPKTNPFLRRVFKSLVDADNMPPSLVWTVEDLAQLIEAADTEAIAAELARFGERRRRGEEVVEHDPIIYFYEHFLRAYDPKKAKQRGVYYTPLPVVSYIVRSIDELLKSEFDLPLGLADQNVVILDPACGTGTFLYEVVRLIYERLSPRGTAYWKNEYVPALLKRLFGFELLMAPYTVAHLKLAELLRDTGYEFAESQRLGIYLTNTLEEAEQHVEQTILPGILGAISKEKELADSVKAEKPVMVVLGNPPYAGHSANTSWKVVTGKKKERNFIGKLLNDYYFVDGEPLGERNPKWLQDDYVKFLRWAQWRIDKTARGIAGMITNHGYLDNPTFRGMRRNLMASFDKLYLLDLHGNAKKKERAPDGGKDENVFDIMQGVAIILAVKNPKGAAA
jgi:type I restriction-modification system DNA methylase subunit